MRQFKNGLTLQVGIGISVLWIDGILGPRARAARRNSTQRISAVCENRIVRLRGDKATTRRKSTDHPNFSF